MNLSDAIKYNVLYMMDVYVILGSYFLFHTVMKMTKIILKTIFIYKKNEVFLEVFRSSDNTLKSVDNIRKNNNIMILLADKESFSTGHITLKK